MADFYAKYSGLFGGGGGGGGGDVVGPSSATDNAIARFDGTTGKLIKNSSVIVDDSGNTSGIANLSAVSATISGLTASQAVVTDGSKNLASVARGTLSDAGTDGIVITGGTSAVFGSGTSIAQHVADTSHNGYLSSTDWNTFNNKQPTVATGDLTDAGTDGIVITGGTGAVIGSGTSIAQHVADSTHNGYLSSTDWSTFNGKQASGNYITSLTGGVTASGPGAAAATVVTNANLTGPITSVGNATSIASQTGTGTKFVVDTSPTIVTPTIAKLANLTTNGYVKTSSSDGTLSVQTVGIPIADGGTGQTTKSAAFDALSPMSASGDVIYGGASGTGTRLPKGADGTVLTLASGLPSWVAAGGASLSYLTATSSAKTSSASDNWNAMTGNSVTLTSGTWLVSGTANFSNNGSGVSYTNTALLWSTANGNDTGTVPATLTVIGGFNGIFSSGATGGLDTINAPTIIVTGGQTIYLDTRAAAVTISNSQITAYITAVKIA